MSSEFLKPTGKKVTATIVTLIGVYLASLISQGILSLMLSKEISALKQNTAVLSMANDLLKDMPQLFVVGIYAIIVKLIVTIVIIYICVCFIFKMAAPKEDACCKSNEVTSKLKVEPKTLPLNIIRKQALDIKKRK